MAQKTAAGGAQRSGSARQQGSQGAAAPAWEWLVALLGLLLVAGSIGYLAFTALTESRSWPSITIETEAVVPDGDGWLVVFKAVNDGGVTAAGLVVRGELKQDGVTVEESEVTLDYVPSDSEQVGSLFFTRNPAQHRLELRPLGYAKP